MPEWCSRSRTLTIRPSDVASVRWYCPDGAWNAQGATEEGRGTLLGPEGAGSSVDHGGVSRPSRRGASPGSYGARQRVRGPLGLPPPVP